VRRAAFALAVAAGLAACGGGEEAPRRPAPFAVEGEVGVSAARTTPATPTPKARPRTAAPAAEPEGRWLTARLVRPTQLRAAPGGRVIARLGRKTEFGSQRVVAVIAERAGWLKVLAPERKDDRPGWIPAANARLGATDVSLVVDRSERRLSLRDGGRTVRSLPIAVGKPGAETPLGRFAVTDKLRPTDAASPYGCCILALSGHQRAELPGWGGGDRLAVHGTPHRETIGEAASLGCMRADKRELERLLRAVPVGAPVFIRS
jgi:lipoprotein-anchoring transpeptidase ErfK/SrfK